MDGDDYFDERDCPSFPLDVDDLVEKNERLQRRICALGRKYAAAYKELEEAREAHGYYANPLPFLQFPREIRDQIYTYALQAPVTVRTHPLPAIYTSMSVFKPPTPGMLLVNSQVYREAKEILYSRNTFAFSETQHMLEFLEQIGEESKDRIQSISFWVDCTPERPNGGANFENGCKPHNWANTLVNGDLKHITTMHVQGEDIINGGLGMLVMDPIMETAIKHVLQRNPGNKAPRKLKLTGYDWNSSEKFPQNWEITTKQWQEPDEEEWARDGNAEFYEEKEEPDVNSELR
ncbi:MAG: hypothetical protein M1836_005633 [Candelina mexicana]|nr:MAG: hypothetical protein M1836_005633 [Candelina mexicana]